MKTQGGKVIRFMEEFLTLGGSFHGEPHGSQHDG